MDLFNSSSSKQQHQQLTTTHNHHPLINPEFPVLYDGTRDFGIMASSIFRSKSSRYRGVQKIKDKETYVAHVYDNGYSPKEGRTIYLGRFNSEANAARAHDLVSLKFWGTSAQTNFPIKDYEKAMMVMAGMKDQDVIAAVRRSSNSFSRGKSKYRGVVRHANSGKWQARKGPGKDSFLGTFETEEEAAIAFDIASIKLKGLKAMTNFDINSYNVKAILDGETEKEAEKFQIKPAKENYFSNIIQEKPETCGLNMSIIGNRKKKRNLNLYNFLGKQPHVIENQHGNFIPFLSFPNEPDTSLSLGFHHSSSSAFQCYKESKSREPSLLQEPNNPNFQLWSSNLEPSSYNTNDLFKEQELIIKSLGVGFHHASSSSFKPFKKP